MRPLSSHVFDRTRLQGVKRRTAAHIAGLMQQDADAERMLQLMSVAAPVYANISTVDAGGGDARMGVPATRTGPPAGGSVWTPGAGSSNDPPSATTAPPKAGAKTPPIARPVTLGDLMPLAHTRLVNVTTFGPKGWDIVYDEHNRPHLACVYRKFKTYEERVALRERLDLDGSFDTSCMNVARAAS